MVENLRYINETNADNVHTSKQTENLRHNKRTIRIKKECVKL